MNSNNLELRLYLSPNPKFATRPHPNRRGSDTLPEILEDKGLSDMGWDELRKIFLPATEEFHDAPCIVTESESYWVKKRRTSLSGIIKNGTGRNSTKQLNEELGEYSMRLHLEHARLLTGRKRMPGYTLTAAHYQGNLSADNLTRTVSITCEAITGSDRIDGSYVHVSFTPEGKAGADWIKKALSLLLPETTTMLPTEDFDVFVKRLCSDFPWTYSPRRRQKR